MANEKRFGIITGGASGLGRALAQELAPEGWHLAICDINLAGAQETVQLLEKAGASGQAELLDVTDPGQWQTLSDKLRSEWPRLDLLVNNAGVAGAGLVGEYSLDDWKWVLDINLWNVIHGTHVFVDWLKSNPRPSHIINTASFAAIASAPGMAAYNVSKAAVVSLSETLWCELQLDNVGVTVICPEFFATNLLEKARFNDAGALKFARKAFEKSSFTAQDVAKAAVDAMKRKKLYVVLPTAAKRRWYLKRVNPQWFLGQVTKLMVRATGGANARKGSSPS
jgi:NAD(P)-dependent dehydrogenase (short-subunit alcohol dehydrogenase family)